jgi:hypothetical protein
MVRIVRQGKEIARYWGPLGEIQMRKISLVAAIVKADFGRAKLGERA